MKKHKLYTSISLLLMICITVAISIFTDYIWAPFLAASGYILRTAAEGLDERADAKTNAKDFENWERQDYFYSNFPKLPLHNQPSKKKKVEAKESKIKIEMENLVKEHNKGNVWLVCEHCSLHYKPKDLESLQCPYCKKKVANSPEIPDSSKKKGK